MARRIACLCQVLGKLAEDDGDAIGHHDDEMAAQLRDRNKPVGGDCARKAANIVASCELLTSTVIEI